MAGYKVFTAGEEALASHANDLFMSQTVARFTNAATRSAAIASPALNQLTMRDDKPGLVEAWNGSSWVPQGTRIITFQVQPNVTAPAPGSITYTLALTLPVPGALFITGAATVTPVSGSTIQQVSIVFQQAPGGPVATFAPAGFSADTPFVIDSVPVFGGYGPQPAGACNVQVAMSAAAGGVPMKMTELSGFVFIQPS